MFAGAGNFRSGLEVVSGFHRTLRNRQIRASGIYGTRDKYYCADAGRIEPYRKPNFDLIYMEFPRQGISITEKRLEFADHSRWTLFFEITRIAVAKQSVYLFMENVPGLISHDGAGRLKPFSPYLLS